MRLALSLSAWPQSKQAHSKADSCDVRSNAHLLREGLGKSNCYQSLLRRRKCLNHERRLEQGAQLCRRDRSADGSGMSNSAVEDNNSNGEAYAAAKGPHLCERALRDS